MLLRNVTQFVATTVVSLTSFHTKRSFEEDWQTSGGWVNVNTALPSLELDV